MFLRWLALASLVGCSSPQGDPITTPTTSAVAVPSSTSSAALPTPSPSRELAFDVKSFDFVTNKDLARRIAETPHAYFRFINPIFSAAACKRFEAETATLPKVRLHGDPHVEQYAVTTLGRGLVDYDDAAIGAAVLDLARFSTSLVLARRVRHVADDAAMSGDAEAEATLVKHFLAGYGAGLAKPSLPAKAPAFAEALRAKFSDDRSGFLDMTDKNMVPLGTEDETFVKAQLATFEKEAARFGAKHPASFYAVKRLGALKLGIGSALGKKFLVRIEGAKKSSDDDVIVELKEVSDRSSVPCVRGLPSGAPDARREQQDAAGAKTLLPSLLLPEAKFWVNQWFSNYEEVRIKKLPTDADLADVAFEAGTLLAMEHLKRAPGHEPPKAEALVIQPALEAKIVREATALAAATIEGWKLFQAEVPVEPPKSEAAKPDAAKGAETPKP